MNIIVAGVGGQGLVLTTQIISEAASRAGQDVKTNDVVGLSQRGGKVWGSVKTGAQVYSPNIEQGTADILIGMEPLEALRWQHYLKPGGLIFLNQAEIYPVFAIAEQAPYPHDFPDRIRKDVFCHSFDMAALSTQLGSAKVVNLIFIGLLAAQMEIPLETWRETITDHVPPNFLELNQQAFDMGLALLE